MVSFCGYFPSEAPKYSCLVQIQIPHGPASGGLQAGSVFSRIAERVYAKHLYRDLAHAKDSTAILVPDIKKGDIKEAAYILQALNVSNNGNSLKGEGPIWGKAETSASYAKFEKIKRIKDWYLT